MQKATKNKTDQKKRTYTITDMDGVPALRIRGKFLADDFGIDIGTQIQMIPCKNMLILMKVPEAVTERNKIEKQLAIAEKKAAYYRASLEASAI